MIIKPTRRGLLRAAAFAAPALIIPKAAGQFIGCLPAFCNVAVTPSCAPISNNVWNASDKTVGITLSNSDKTTTAVNIGGGIRSVGSHISGNWYLELTVTTMTGNIFTNDGIGLCIASTPLGSLFANVTALFITVEGHIFNGNNAELGALSNLQGQIVGIAYNGGLGLTWARSSSTSNIWRGSGAGGLGDPITGTDGYPSPFGGNAVFAFMSGDGSTTDVVTINQVPTYAPPTGYCIF
jgi:hypothetical protein